MYYNIYWRIKGEKEVCYGVVEMNTTLIHRVKEEFITNNPFDIEIIKIVVE
ncbi:MAG: hypothetical protein ACRC28_18440 [Clostridium sp.]|uniref:hypothetical protein n=1 Tax=Clostridium sp. TaxID=1506 RepID=UPI003F3F66B0